MMRRSVLALLFASLAAAFAAEIPAGTDLHVRLESKAASTLEAGTRLEAILAVPVMQGEQYLLPPRASIRGTILEASPAKPDERGALRLDFSEIEVNGGRLPLKARVISVDNARESVDESGRIVGILASETLSAQMDRGIESLASRQPGLADVLAAIKGSIIRQAETEIVYEPGVDLTIRLLEPLDVEPGVAEPELESMRNLALLEKIVNAQPHRTFSETPRRPSDLTNLMFLGTREQVEKAFDEAGWSVAHELTAQSALETVRAIVELRGYKEAPVSILRLDGKIPDLAYQKQNNTFAMRHHLRIWQRPETFEGTPVWVAAATHDTGIEFSQQDLTFIHTIDPLIDRERAKIVTDLLLTGRVRSLALVPRPDVPKATKNATGDRVETDGRMAVLALR